MQRAIITKTPDGWEGIEPEGYVPGAATSVVRHTLVGGCKDEPGAAGPANELRYFDLPPGTGSRLEKHEHEHFVIIGPGSGMRSSGTPFARCASTTSSTSGRSYRISSSIAATPISVSSAWFRRHAMCRRSLRPRSSTDCLRPRPARSPIRTVRRHRANAFPFRV